MRALVVAAALAAGGCVGGGGGGGGAPLPFERGELSADGAPRCDFEKWCEGVLLIHTPQADGMTFCSVPFGETETPDDYGAACVSQQVAAEWEADPCGQREMPVLWVVLGDRSRMSAQGPRLADPDWKVNCYTQSTWAHEVLVKGRGIDRFDEDGKLIPESSTPR
jgi:hypothetical protein